MQIVVFTLEDKEYAINSTAVEEIIKKMDSTVVPKSPAWIEGLINLRGNVVPLVNLSKLLHREDNQCYTNIVIIKNQDGKIGILVNEIKEVRKINDEDIEKGSIESGNGIVGIIQLDGRLVNYIDLDLLI